MNNVWTVARRELQSYFATPIASIFLIIFLALAGFLTFQQLRASRAQSFRLERLHGTKEQGQRGAQLVAHIGEEPHLRLVELFEVLVDLLELEPQGKISPAKSIAHNHCNTGKKTDSEKKKEWRKHVQRRAVDNEVQAQVTRHDQGAKGERD